MFGQNYDYPGDTFVDAIYHSKNKSWSDISTSTNNLTQLKEVEAAAYQKGIKDGDEKRKKDLIKCVSENLKSSTNMVENLIKESNTNYNISYKRIFLRISSPNTFDFLLLIQKEIFIKNEFLEIYSLVRRVKKKFDSRDLEISINFLPISKLSDINKNNIISDGYHFQYGREKSKNKKSKSSTNNNL